MKRLIYSIALMAMAAPVVANAQEFDDIYYNPKKDKTVNQTKTKKQSNYIKDFSSIDVDQYNRRGQYYASPIDTIGAKAESDEDFVYTQQIQKYYNPTIVVDNADVLADVLNNSYGNVEITFDNGVPMFSPYYSYDWPYYNSYYGWNSWNYGWGPSWSWSWNWGPSWAWGPSWNWSWNWGPSWGWGPSWSWGWGWNNPWNWGWGPGWGPSWGHVPGRPYADYRPGGRLPNRPGSNWASNTRPGGNYNGGHSAAGGGYRPTNSGVNNRPNNSNSVFGGSATNHHRTYGTANGNTGTHSTNAGNSQSGNRNSYTINSNGHRTYNNSSTLNNNTNNSNNNHRQTTNNNSYNNSTRNNNYNYNSNSSRGGSFGSGGSRGGSFGGGGRSSGGGGARGTHR